MQIGAENRKKAIAAGALFLVAIVMFLRMFVGGSSASSTSATTPSNTPSTQPARAARRQPARKLGKTQEKSGPLTPSLDPRLHLGLLADSEQTEYTGHGRNLFDLNAVQEIPKAEGSGLVAKAPEPPPPPVNQGPPPPPPINLKFYGFTSSGGQKKVFLMQNDDVFVASEGDIVQRRYKIVKINSNNVEVLDVLSNNKQSIPLQAG